MEPESLLKGLRPAAVSGITAEHVRLYIGLSCAPIYIRRDLVSRSACGERQVASSFLTS